MMKKELKNLFVVLTMLLCLLTGCSGKKESQDTSKEDSVLKAIHERKVLKVGTTGDYQPMSY
ncbi:MAG: hypothetical protein IKF80_03225, partial [Erysipelotrichaceae bacterium]|nr:hypothetical protein [Erysipelotrichaceae bacterium]